MTKKGCRKIAKFAKTKKNFYISDCNMPLLESKTTLFDG